MVLTLVTHTHYTIVYSTSDPSQGVRMDGVELYEERYEGIQRKRVCMFVSVECYIYI